MKKKLHSVRGFSSQPCLMTSEAIFVGKLITKPIGLRCLSTFAEAANRQLFGEWQTQPMEAKQKGVKRLGWAMAYHLLSRLKGWKILPGHGGFKFAGKIIEVFITVPDFPAMTE